MVRGQNEGAGIAMCVLPPLAFHRPASRLFLALFMLLRALLMYVVLDVGSL